MKELVKLKASQPVAKVIAAFVLGFAVSLGGVALGFNLDNNICLISLSVAFIAGGFLLRWLHERQSWMVLPFYLVWTLLSGAIAGPAVHAFRDILGWHTLSAALVGTVAVLTFYAAVFYAARLDVSRLSQPLMVVLALLVVFGLLSFFVNFDRDFVIVDSLIGINVFALFFAVTLQALFPSSSVEAAKLPAGPPVANGSEPEESAMTQHDEQSFAGTVAVKTMPGKEVDVQSWFGSLLSGEDLFLSFMNLALYLIQLMAIFYAFSTLDIFRVAEADAATRRALALVQILQRNELGIMLACLFALRNRCPHTPKHRKKR